MRRAFTHALGLDVSKKATGYCVLEVSSGRLMAWGAWGTGSIDGTLATARHVRDQLEELKTRCEGGKVEEDSPGVGALWKVAVESYLRGFAAGGFQQQQLFTLAEVNAVVSHECERIFGEEPLPVFPTSSRALFGLNAPGPYDPPGSALAGRDLAKERVLSFVSACNPGYEWTKRKNGQLCPTVYDQADAYLLSHYSLWAARTAHLAASEALWNDWSAGRVAVKGPRQLGAAPTFPMPACPYLTPWPKGKRASFQGEREQHKEKQDALLKKWGAFTQLCAQQARRSIDPAARKKI
jgi:hypothetical protein